MSLRIPNFPKMPRILPPEVQRAFDAITGFFKQAEAAGGLATVDGVATEVQSVLLDTSTPPQMTGLVVTGLFDKIMLQWDAYPSEAQIEIHRSETDDLGAAAQVGQCPSTQSIFSDLPPDSSLSVTYYYWIRANRNGTPGPWNQTAGTPGNTANDPAYMIEVLSGALDSVTATINATDLVFAAESFALRMAGSDPGTFEYPFIVAEIPGAPGTFGVYMSNAFIVNLTSTNIQAGGIAADRLDVDTLSAISADLGTVTAGTVVGVTFTGGSFTGGTFTGGVIQTATSGKRTVVYASDYADADVAGEIHVYDDLGGGLEEVANIGKNQSGTDSFVAIFGSNTSGNIVNGLAAKSYGGWAVSAISIDGDAVLARSTNSYGLWAGSDNGTGTRSAGAIYDFYATGSGANYGPFTGAHDGLIPKELIADVGDIIIDVEIANKSNLSNCIAFQSVSSTQKSKSVIGVFVGRRSLTDKNVPSGLQEWIYGVPEPIASVYGFQQAYDLTQINAVGEGQINVCKDGGNISAGDYICSSNRAGKGMKQDDDLLHNYTVAKAREDCVWLEGEDDIRMIACSYHCG